MTERGRQVSRRGLFSLVGRGLSGFRDSLRREAPNLVPAARARRGTAAGGAAGAAAGRILRPPEETLAARPFPIGGWVVDLIDRPLPVGESVKVEGGGLPEPVVLVRVLPQHVAACGSECPVEGSDLVWDAAGDRLRCPSCGSEWRLDGEQVRGPADCRISQYLAEERAALVRLRPLA